MARALRMGPGGTGMQALAAARLGLSVALVARLGQDAAGRLVRQALEAEGVAVTGPPDGTTSAAEKGREAGPHAGVPVTALLATERGVAMATALGGPEVEAPDVAAVPARAVLLSLGRAALAPTGTALYAVTGGLEIEAVDEATWGRVSGARALILNASEAARLTQETDPRRSAKALAKRVPTAVVTLAEAGALAAEGERVTHVRAPRVKVRDATGAGDLFAAAYLWADLNGAPLDERVAWATLYASLSVAAPTAFEGAVAGEALLREGAGRGLARPPGLAPSDSCGGGRARGRFGAPSRGGKAGAPGAER